MGKKGPAKSSCADNGEVANSGGDPTAGRATEIGWVKNWGSDPVVAIMEAGGCGVMGGSGDCLMVSGSGDGGDRVVVSGVSDPEVARLMVSSGSGMTNQIPPPLPMAQDVNLELMAHASLANTIKDA